MNLSRRIVALTAMLIFLTQLAMPNLAAAQGLTSLNETGRGKGTLTVGREVFKVHAVVVKLKEDGTGELTLVTDLTLFFDCAWSASADLSKGIDLKMTSKAGTGPQASGKLFLRPDGKSIASLTIKGTSNTLRRKVQLNFVAE